MHHAGGVFRTKYGSWVLQELQSQRGRNREGEASCRDPKVVKNNHALKRSAKSPYKGQRAPPYRRSSASGFQNKQNAVFSRHWGENPPEAFFLRHSVVKRVTWSLGDLLQNKRKREMRGRRLKWGLTNFSARSGYERRSGLEEGVCCAELGSF